MALAGRELTLTEILWKLADNSTMGGGERDEIKDSLTSMAMRDGAQPPVISLARNSNVASQPAGMAPVVPVVTPEGA
jgi:hypothetical protein